MFLSNLVEGGHFQKSLKNSVSEDGLYRTLMVHETLLQHKLILFYNNILFLLKMFSLNCINTFFNLNVTAIS